MKIILFCVLVFSLNLQANCSSFFLLGSTNQSVKQTIISENTIVWKSSKKRWSDSKPYNKVVLENLSCDDSAYLLINNNDISYETPNYGKNSYSLKRGWNYLHSHENGVDIEKTFKGNNFINFVYVYDKPTQAWAGFSPQKNLQSIMQDTRILSLKKIEPNRGFYVYATRSINVNIQSVEISSSCKKIINNNKFTTLTNSGTNNAKTYNKDKTISIKSRYLSHHRIGIYDETRIMFIYPRLESKTKDINKYGPANPKALIEYSEAYEEKKFYMFDFKQEKCFEGRFPSKMVPPFSSLKELK